MKKAAYLIFIVLMGTGCVHLYGQEFKVDSVTTMPIKAETANESIIGAPTSFLFPDFYSFWPVDKNDTILKYECFDLQDNLINTDTLHNIDYVHYILLIKTYTDYTRTYIDPDGKPQPQPVTSRIYKYDKSGSDTWLRKDYLTKESANLKEYRDEIVRSDSTSCANPVTGTRQLTIRKYYKVEQDGPQIIETNK